MFYHPIIDTLASQPLTYLVTPAAEQKIEGQTACFCPFCRQKRVAGAGGVTKQNQNGSETPHFIIYHQMKGGVYGSNDGQGVERWQCTRTGRRGYGALELYAAIHGLTLEGEDLRRACFGFLRDHTSMSIDEIRERWPELMRPEDKDSLNTWSRLGVYTIEEKREQQQFTFIPRADSSPQELHALGCEVTQAADGTIRFSWDGSEGQSSSAFTPKDIIRDFRIRALDRCTLPTTWVKGEAKTYTLVSTPWCPLYVCFAGPSINQHGEGLVGCVFAPTLANIQTGNQPAFPIVFSNDEGHTVAKVSKWLGGDATFCYAMDHRDSESTAVKAAIDYVGAGESVAKTRQQWEPQLDKDGLPTGKMKLETVEIPDRELKARHIIHCLTPQDALSTYYTLQALRESRMSFNDGKDAAATETQTQMQQTCWYHVSFLLGRGKFWWLDHGEWKQSNVEFGTVQHNKLARFADTIYLLYPNDLKSNRLARAISRRFRDIYMAQLPETFHENIHWRQSRIFGHIPFSVRDFVLAYKMMDEQAFQYDRDFRKFFRTILQGALTSCPLERKEKRDRNNAVKEVYYVVDPATVWVFMAGEGYFRDVETDTDDKIGRYVRVEGCFVDSLDADSMVARTFECMRDYARDNAPSTEEFRLMLQGIARATKEVNSKTIASLPSIHIDYESGYGPQVEHFFFANCALRITPKEIRTVSYEDIDFNVDRREQMPWNFSMPMTEPFSITENPEYIERAKAINDKAEEKDDMGLPLYSLQQISAMRSDLMQWGLQYRWLVDWKGKEPKEMWRPLQVLRGFANVEWEEEDRLSHEGKTFSPVQQSMLNAHFANLIFCLGRVMWRYRTNKSNCVPYLLEDMVKGADVAQGGSGKSSFVKVFAGSACYIYDVDCKDLQPGKEMSFQLSEYVPHRHRIVHWEDWAKSMPLKAIYNYATSGFGWQKKFVDKKTVDINEGPGHIISSNYPISDTDDSTLRRFVMGSFSNRFCGENPLKNKPARFISDVMPDFNASKPELLNPSTRNQIIFMDALAVQFAMANDTIVNAPNENTKLRTLERTLTEAFVAWASYFFGQPAVYGIPIDLSSALEEYKREFTDASVARKEDFALATFKKRVHQYCEFAQIEYNPPHLLRNKKDIAQKCFHFNTWCEKKYFFGHPWDQHASYQYQGMDGQTYRCDIQPKVVREIGRSDSVYYFYRKGVDKVPESYEKLREQQRAFLSKPDPMPIIDPQTGDPVFITDQERYILDHYADVQTRQTTAGGAQIVNPNGNGGTFGVPQDNNNTDEKLPF